MLLRLWSLLRMFRHDLLLVLISLRHKDTPSKVKGIFLMVLVYLVSPIDLIPDALPVAGVIDDAVIVPAAMALMVRMLPYHVWQDSEYRLGVLRQHKSAIFVVVALVLILWSALVIWGVAALISKLFG